ncbi:serine/threonine protein kinase [Actinoplanes sp. TBRC 11911]|nr:serine/threonine protein kinase [Actinoplanes sp. TBRC 11911]
MGRVWLARDEMLRRDVALKEIMLPVNEEAPLREARAAARISHPGVAQVYDTFSDDGRSWIVMEYVPSRSLQAVLDTDGPLPPERAAEIGLAVLAALAAAHASGVRHRDVKPANVLLADDGRVVLTDFGVAAVDGDSLATSSGLILGSPQYMAPERVRSGAATPAADLWSLGATLFASVEGHSPYARRSVMETVTAVASEEPERPTRAGALDQALDGLLRKDPAERIGAAETERLLRAAVATQPARAPVPAISRRGSAPVVGRRRRSAFIAAAVTAVVVVAGGVGGWLASRPADKPDVTAAPRPTTSASASPARSSSAPSSAPVRPSGQASAAPVLPAGWTRYRDPTGFSLYVPRGWTRSKEGSIVYFRGAGRVLGIDQTDKPQPDPVADWRGKAGYRVARGDFPAYHEVHIRAVKYFRKAADWEFTFTRSGVRQHVNNRGFITSPTQAYGIYWQCPDAGWQSAEKDLRLVFGSFRPADD